MNSDQCASSFRSRSSLPYMTCSEPEPNLGLNRSKLDCKEFDPITFDVIKVDPSDFADQLTLKDIRMFKAIRPDELTTCGWNSKEKLSISPNVVSFTRRFNHVCLWCQREILASERAKSRADILAHFIKIAKRLLDLGNLHSAFAIVSGLQSLPIYRLSKTWNNVSTRDKSSLEKMARLFADDKNWERLRKLIHSMKLPCIPYLGLYLTDLTYIDVVHPKSGTNKDREIHINNILRVIAYFQDSAYDSITPIECILTYLHSVRFIDELQKFLEDDLFKLSLSRESKVPLKVPSMRCDSMMKMHRKQNNSLTQTVDGSFRKHHRKTQSLGGNSHLSGCQLNASYISNEADGPGRHLLDDSLFDNLSCVVSSSFQSHPHPFHDDAHRLTVDSDGRLLPLSISPVDQAQLLPINNRPSSVFLGGVVHRSTFHGWTRYWLTLSDLVLSYYRSKSLTTHNRRHRCAYRSDVCKMHSVSEWLIFLSCDSSTTNCFQLQQPTKGNVYKFRCDSQVSALEWVRNLKMITGKNRPKLPANLMSFD